MGREEEEEEEEEEEGNNLANAHIPAKKRGGERGQDGEHTSRKRSSRFATSQAWKCKKKSKRHFRFATLVLPIFADMFIIAFSFTKSNVAALPPPPLLRRMRV